MPASPTASEGDGPLAGRDRDPGGARRRNLNEIEAAIRKYKIDSTTTHRRDRGRRHVHPPTYLDEVHQDTSSCSASGTMLVVCQVTVCVLLLITAGILLRGVDRIHSLDATLSSRNTIQIVLQEKSREAVLSRLSSEPSIELIAAARNAPVEKKSIALVKARRRRRDLGYRHQPCLAGVLPVIRNTHRARPEFHGRRSPVGSAGGHRQPDSGPAALAGPGSGWPVAEPGTGSNDPTWRAAPPNGSNVVGVALRA